MLVPISLHYLYTSFRLYYTCLQNPKSNKSRHDASAAYDVDTLDDTPSSSAHISGCFCGDGCAHSISKYIYAAFFVFSSVVAVVLKWSAISSFETASAFDICETAICRGNQVVYRVSFALAVFFFMMTIGTLISRNFHFNMWIFKFLFLAGMITASFFIPGNVFQTYQEIARIVSIIYLIIEVFLLINMAYTIHDTLMGYMAQNESDDQPHAAALGGTPSTERGCIQRHARSIYIFLSFTLALAGVACGIVLFVLYGKCELHNALIGIVFAIGLVLIILSVTNCVGKGLLVPSVLFVYSMFNLFSSLDANPNGECNPYAKRNNPLWMLIISITFTLLAMGRSASSAADDAPMFLTSLSGGKPGAVQEDDNTSGPEPVELDYIAAGEKRKKLAAREEQRAKNEIEKHRSKLIFIYHIIMLFASCYLAMMLTGWGSEHTEVKLNAPDRSKQSMWFKFGSICLTYLLYFWTIIAPLLCRSRSFEG